MKVLVTGGTGFIGRRLVASLLAKGELAGGDGRQQEIDGVVVADVVAPAQPLPDDPRLQTVIGDFSAPGAARQLLGSDTGAVFHLAAVVSGEAEQNFDLGMRVNLHGTESLLEECRRLETCPRFVFTSSVAVYGGDMPEVIEDDTPLTPQTSYGSQKAMGEFLVNDFTRKGFVDGRALRLPTVVVRAGKPNQAASSFASAVLREPLQGDVYVCPVSAATNVYALSPRRVVESLLHGAQLPAEAWGAHRALFLPGITVSVGEMVEALRQVGGEEVAGRVRFEPDSFIEKIVYGWPTRFAARRAEAMGFRPDAGIRDIVDAFVEDELGGRIA